MNSWHPLATPTTRVSPPLPRASLRRRRVRRRRKRRPPYWPPSEKTCLIAPCSRRPMMRMTQALIRRMPEPETLLTAKFRTMQPPTRRNMTTPLASVTTSVLHPLQGLMPVERVRLARNATTQETTKTIPAATMARFSESIALTQNYDKAT